MVESNKILPQKAAFDLFTSHINLIIPDFQQCMAGSCSKNDVAIRVATRVIGHYPNRNQILVDCGFLGLSHDGKGAIPNGALCVIDKHPELM